MAAFAAPVAIPHRGAHQIVARRPHRRRARTGSHVRHLTCLSAAATSEGSESASAEESGNSPPVPMPTLYSAWFPPGNEIAAQLRVAIAASLADGRPRMEINFPCVPNLEEIKFGTKNNFEFGKHVARTLGMDGTAEYPLIKRYLGEFCNLYWCLEIAKSFPDRTVWAVFTDSVSKEKAGPVGNLRIASFQKDRLPQPADGDVVIIVDPRPTDVWKKGEQLAASPTSPLIFLNSEFNETYGLVGPRMGKLKDVETVYYLKRVTRGYAFRAYPHAWQAILELPDCSCEVLKTFEKMPKLSDVAGIVRMTSNDRYGAFNDRYAKGFGGRL